jgi:hypothetical protein
MTEVNLTGPPGPASVGRFSLHGAARLELACRRPRRLLVRCSACGELRPRRRRPTGPAPAPSAARPAAGRRPHPRCRRHGGPRYRRARRRGRGPISSAGWRRSASPPRRWAGCSRGRPGPHPRVGSAFNGVNIIGLIPGHAGHRPLYRRHRPLRPRRGQRGQVYNGADDNASGVATMLALAAELKRQAPSTAS